MNQEWGTLGVVTADYRIGLHILKKAVLRILYTRLFASVLVSVFDWLCLLNYNPHSADFSKSPQPQDFSLARTATLTVHSTPRPAKLSTHLGDSQAPGQHTADFRSFRWQDISSSCLVFFGEQIMQKSDKLIKQLLIPMYISPWKHNVHVCKQLDGSVILDIQCTQAFACCPPYPQLSGGKWKIHTVWTVTAWLCNTKLLGFRFCLTFTHFTI